MRRDGYVGEDCRRANMGEYLREAQRRLTERADSPGRLRQAGVSGLVIVLAVLAVSFLVAGVIRQSPLGIVGSLVLAASALLWCLSDRVPEHPESRATRLFRDMPEVKLAALSIVCFLVGGFTWPVGMIKGW
jgi:hypothetical protein